MNKILTGHDSILKERKQIVNDSICELIQDLNFSRGFIITKFHANSSGGAIAGSFDYAGKKAPGAPVWGLGQWGCRFDFTKAATTEGGFERDGNLIRYEDVSKLVCIDAAKTGCIRLAIKGSNEYGKNVAGEWIDRMDPAQNWPHNIIGQDISCISIADAKRLFMEIDYTVNSCERKVKTAADPSMHAAQFQWFITLSNNNKDSADFGSAMWFGFNMFDTRSIGTTPPGYQAYDGGKEDNTGMFIYMFSLKDAALDENNTVTLPTSVIGRRRSIKVDILPFIKTALKVAVEQGAMLHTNIQDLGIGSTNVGIELPGSYDVDVQIHSMNMYKVLKNNL